jgi:hypothetical protein
MLKKEYLAKIFVVFGAATLITWVVNIISLIIPFQFTVVKWVYLVSQEISEKSIFPFLGILAIVGGVYLCKSAKEAQNSKCKCAGWSTNLCALFCTFFFAGLVTMAVIFSLSIKPIQNDIKTQIMSEANNVKTQITMMAQANKNVKQENVRLGLQDIDQIANQEIKKATKDVIINSIKILIGLILFALVNLISAIYLIKMSLFKNKCNNNSFI